LIEKLARIGREGLDVAALAFGVDGVERKRRLAGAAEPRNHREGVARDFDINVFQVVMARAMHSYPLEHRGGIENELLFSQKSGPVLRVFGFTPLQEPFHGREMEGEQG
jgi:hypothetical protein